MAAPAAWCRWFPSLGTTTSRSSACRATFARRPIPGSSPTLAITQDPKPAFVHDDNFDSGKLNPLWQWNHVPDDTKWSLTEKPGVLRLHSLPANDFYSARNSLCQRPPGPESIMTVELDTTGLAAGDTAGLALLSTPYAWIGVVKSAEGTTLQMLHGRRRPPSRRRRCPGQSTGDGSDQSSQPPVAARRVQL